jgi:hypothetical protein
MSSQSTNFAFRPGLLTILMDVNAGSSGKGKIGSYICEHADNFQFLCNTFHPQAGHWVRLDDGREFFYQSLNSFAYGHDRYEKMYLGAGAMIELSALLREIKENGVPAHKLGISPVVPILDPEIDGAFEQGRRGFDDAAGSSLPGVYGGTARFGSTSHGVGSCNARRALRRPSLRLAQDVPELAQYICDVGTEVTDRLRRGQAGLLEVAQGYQLSLMHQRFYPFVTSRNVTAAQAMSDMFLAPRYAGHVVANIRTYPIRINSNKYVAPDGRHLTWADVQSGVPHTVFHGNSGGWYSDQKEVTWDELTRSSGSPEPIVEMTSVTKLPRRVATFSASSLEDFYRHNDCGHGISLSVNFANYVDHAVSGARQPSQLTGKVREWLAANLRQEDSPARLRFVGTGALTDDLVLLPSGLNSLF